MPYGVTWITIGVTWITIVLRKESGNYLCDINSIKLAIDFGSSKFMVN